MKTKISFVLCFLLPLLSIACSGSKDFTQHVDNSEGKNTPLSSSLGHSISFFQNTFSDDFESGDFSKWDRVNQFLFTENNVHIGNKSIKCVLSGVQQAYLIKRIPSNEFKIDLYVYISNWEEAYGGFGIKFNEGTNNNWEIWSSCGSYLRDCDRNTLVGNSIKCDCWRLPKTTCVNFAKNGWNHIVVEKTSKGNMSAWINDKLTIENIYIGDCPTNEISLNFLGCCNNSRVTGYIDDVMISYSKK